METYTKDEVHALFRAVAESVNKESKQYAMTLAVLQEGGNYLQAAQVAAQIDVLQSVYFSILRTVNRLDIDDSIGPKDLQ